MDQEDVSEKVSFNIFSTTQAATIKKYLQSCATGPNEFVRHTDQMTFKDQRSLKNFLDGGSPTPFTEPFNVAKSYLKLAEKRGEAFYFPRETSFLRRLACHKCGRLSLGSPGSIQFCSADTFHIICFNCSAHDGDKNDLFCLKCKSQLIIADPEALEIFRDLAHYFRIPCRYQPMVSLIYN